jgi:hypothetical protein
MRLPIGLVRRLVAIYAAAGALGPAAANPANPGHPGQYGTLRPVLFRSNPLSLTVAQLEAQFDYATVSDVEIADFDRDGLNDIAVAWFATDLEDRWANRRRLSVFRGTGTGFELLADIDLYIPDPNVPALSVFRNGTADIAVGDFDGDGDADIAATAFFGDELWVLENDGAGRFTAHLKFPFYFNSTGNFITPPEALAADFDLDGRDELVYLADPCQQIEGRIVHFWKTNDTIANLVRVDWQGIEDPILTSWTRALAVADFDGDGRPDLCYTGTRDPPHETQPVVTLWYGLNVRTGIFRVLHLNPAMVCSDVADLATSSGPGLILTDRDGLSVQYWSRTSTTPLTFQVVAELHGYAGLSPGRGMAAAAADLNGDGFQDLVTKQKTGDLSDHNQIEITMYDPTTGTWYRATPTPIDTGGYRSDPANTILRPRNLAVGDLLGNRLPEIVAGFSALPPRPGDPPGGSRLEVAIWQNSCTGDVTRDGRTDGRDLAAVAGSLGRCAADPGFNPDADLDRDGCISELDLRIVAADVGCACCELAAFGCADSQPGDSNCDGLVNAEDAHALELAVVMGQQAWEALYGGNGCGYSCVNDVNGDGEVDSLDVGLLPLLLEYLPR